MNESQDDLSGSERFLPWDVRARLVSVELKGSFTEVSQYRVRIGASTESELFFLWDVIHHSSARFRVDD